LPIHISDKEIEVTLTHFMAKDGRVFIKVKRTRQGLPFAHVQYFVSTADEFKQQEI
jgi:hypothetical protein